MQSDIFDSENEELIGELTLVWRSLLLAAPVRPISGEAWVLTGSIGVSDRRFIDIKSQSGLGAITPPFYASQETFKSKIHSQNDDNWLDRWSDLVGRLRGVHKKLPEAIRLAVLSYEVAHKQHEIEFRIPAFVRATEAVLGIPKNCNNAECFAERTLKLAPHLQTHWWVGQPDLASRLKRLYRHRNDCVHGKVPFSELRTQGTAGSNEAACFEYLAEITAREALLFAIKSPEVIAAAADRTKLEQAWQQGSFVFPSVATLTKL